MAKGDVTLKFDATTATFVQAVNAAREKLLAGADAGRKFGDDVAKGGDKAESGMKKAADSARDLAIKMTGIGAATDIATKAFDVGSRAIEAYYERVRAKAEAALGVILKVNTALGAAGQEVVAPQIRAQLSKITVAGGQLVNPEEAASTYAAISRATGNKVTPRDKLKATEAALIGRGAHLDEEGSQQLGINFAQLSRERRDGGEFENYSDEQLRDLAYKVTVNKPEGLSDKDMRFFARAHDKNQALNLIFAAAQSDESARGLASIQQAATEDIDPQKVKEAERQIHRHKATAEDARILALSKVPKEIRFDAMLANPDLAPPADRLGIENLREGMNRIPQTRGLAWEVREQQKVADDATKAADESKNADALAAQYRAEGGIDSLRHMNREKILETLYTHQHPYASAVGIGWIARKLRLADEEGRAHYQVRREDAHRQISRGGLLDIDTSEVDRLLKSLGGPAQAPSVSTPSRSSPTTQPSEVHGELKTQTELMRQQVGHMQDLSQRQAEQNSIQRTANTASLTNNNVGQQ